MTLTEDDGRARVPYHTSRVHPIDNAFLCALIRILKLPQCRDDRLDSKGKAPFIPGNQGRGCWTRHASHSMELCHISQCSLRLPKMPIEKLTPLHPYPSSSYVSPSSRSDRRYTGRVGRPLSSKVAIVFAILSTYALIPLPPCTKSTGGGAALPIAIASTRPRPPNPTAAYAANCRCAGNAPQCSLVRSKGEERERESARRRTTDRGRRHVRRTLPPHTVSWSGCSASNSAPDSGFGGDAAEPWNPTPGLAAKFEV